MVSTISLTMLSRQFQRGAEHPPELTWISDSIDLEKGKVVATREGDKCVGDVFHLHQSTNDAFWKYQA